jgi:hypothetical protein
MIEYKKKLCIYIQLHGMGVTLSIVILKSYFSYQLIVQHQEAKYVESWPNTTLPRLAGADLIFQWIAMVEYVPCYFAP